MLVSTRIEGMIVFDIVTGILHGCNKNPWKVFFIPGVWKTVSDEY